MGAFDMDFRMVITQIPQTLSVLSVVKKMMMHNVRNRTFFFIHRYNRNR